MSLPLSKTSETIDSVPTHRPQSNRGRLQKPAIILVVNLVLTMGVIGWLGWNTFVSYDVVRTILPENERLYQLRGEIIYLDEVSTMAAIMSAMTEESDWEERYQYLVPQLDAAIKEAVSLVPTDIVSQISTKIDGANMQLVDMELQSFQAVREGRPEEARAILLSEEYKSYKAVYASGTQELLDYLQSRAVDQGQQVQQRAQITFISMLLVIPVLIALWTWVLRYLQTSMTLRDSLLIAQTREQELEEVQKTQETLIAERTASLQEALQTVERREAALEQTVTDLQTSQDMVRELSAPIIPVLQGVLVAPLIGSIDSIRATTFQTNVLEMVEAWKAHSVIIDITGVPVVDTHVSQVLLETTDAVRMLGATVSLVGVRPEVAQTIVGLGVDLSAIPSYPDLQAAVQNLSQQTNHRKA
ncbi:MAG: STAS domain-containing protein [Chloroflexota bacterium]